MRTSAFRDGYDSLRAAGFTAQDIYNSGPLYNPTHPKCQEGQLAMRAIYVVMKLERLKGELEANLSKAQQDAKMASAILYHERLSLGAMARRGYVEPQLAKERYLIKQAELAVLSAHDKLWAAQQALKLWEHTYGPQALGVGL